MNTQNRSLSDLAARSQSGLPRRGMRTGTATRGQAADLASPVYTSRAPTAQATDARRLELPQLFPLQRPEARSPTSQTGTQATAVDTEQNALQGVADIDAPSPADQAHPFPDLTPAAAAARRAESQASDAAQASPSPAFPDSPVSERQHAQQDADLAPPEVSSPVASVAAAWDALKRVPLDAAHLDRHRMISARREDPSHAAFDVLRTRLMQALADNGWRRVAITSPTKNCGKSFVAANLALSLSRAYTRRTLLMDMDLRNPSLAKLLGVPGPGPIGDLLRGKTRPELHIRRFAENALGIGPSLAFGLNDRVERDAAELLQTPEAAAALGRLDALLRPDIVLYDLPPALYHDDVLAFHGQYDGVLLVVGGGITKPDEVTEVSRRLADHTPLLGVVLNRAEGPSIRDYSY
jgi:Mrp family chromosome partitioning ATPase